MMNQQKTSPIRRFAAGGIAIVLLFALYGAARLPQPTLAQREELAAPFHFVRHPMPEMAGQKYQNVRKVAPSLERISGWISGVGAAASLGDLDGDGLPNDCCWVDTRTDLLTVASLPPGSDRYQTFVLDAAPLKYDSTMAPMGSVIGDFNEDGLMDVLAFYWGRPPIAFLQGKTPSKSGLARTSFVAQEVVPYFERWYTCTATTADIDGDGHLDIVIGNYFQDGARILDPTATGVEVMHNTKSRSFNGGHKRILRWTGATASSSGTPEVRYEEVKNVFSEDVSRGWTLAIGAADLDGDMLPEIYFAHDFGPDRLLHNRSRPGHIELAVVEGVRDLMTPKSCVLGQDSFKGMGIDFADLNGDGLLDIYVSNIAANYALHESHFVWLSTGDVAAFRSGRAPYVQGSEKLGLSRSSWSWDCRLADFDNDGVVEAVQAAGFMKGEINRWPELQSLGTANDQIMHDPRLWPKFRPGDDLSGHDPDAFFVRGSDGKYHDVAEEVGLGEPMNSRAIATADVDGDGRLDMVIANQFGPSYFFANQSETKSAFLGLHVLLPCATASSSATPLSVHAGHPAHEILARPAIGAAITVHLPDGRKLVGQVDGGNGFAGRRSSDLHFGLGKIAADTKLRIDLRWRDTSGTIREGSVTMTPGWNTVILGAADSGDKRI
jgi:hypothetical protein